MDTKPNFHLEISGRGTAKSYALVQDIIANQVSKTFIAYVNCPSLRMTKYIIEKVKYYGGDETRVIPFLKVQELSGKNLINSKLYFDDFDWNGNLKVEDIKDIKIDTYYCSSPSRKRDITEFSVETDVLAKLIEMNNGIVFKRNFINKWSDARCIKDAKSALTAEQFDLEYCANYLK